MRMISDGIWLLLLILLSFLDIKDRQVPGCLLYGAGIYSLIYQVMSDGRDIFLIFGGIIIGCIFIFISKITEEGLGYGDSYGILMLGIYLGMWKILSVLLIAFSLLLCISILFMWKKRMNRKIAIPFFPFLTGGYFLFILMGGQ